MDNVKQDQFCVELDQIMRKREREDRLICIDEYVCCRGANYSDAQHYQCCSGFYIDIFNILKERLKFQFELYQVLDRTWGSRNSMTVKDLFISSR